MEMYQLRQNINNGNVPIKTKYQQWKCTNYDKISTMEMYQLRHLRQNINNGNVPIKALKTK